MKMLNRRQLLAGSAAQLPFAGSCGVAHAAVPITVVIPYPPGGIADNVARLLLQTLQQSTRDRFIVINKPGANGTLAIQDVLHSQPSERKLLFAASSAILPYLQSSKRHENLTNKLHPLKGIVFQDSFLVVSRKLDVNDLRELIILLRARRSFSYGSIGTGSIGHVLAASFVDKIKADVTHVPYKGSPALLIDLVNGDLAFSFSAYENFRAHLANQRVKTVAVASPTRSESLPDVPTMSEMGFPEVTMRTWLAIFAPAHASQWLPEDFDGKIDRSMRDPELMSKLQSMNMARLDLTRDALVRFVSTEVQRWDEWLTRLRDLGQIE